MKTSQIFTHRFSLASANIAVVCCLCLLCLGCATSSTALRKNDDCIKPNMTEVKIRWGTWNDSTAVLDGYEIDAQCRLFRYSASEYSVKYLRDSIGTVDRAVLCTYIDTIRKAFVHVQSLSVRAPLMHYVEYQNPAADLSLRARWDTRFETYGSTEFRAIFDSLSTIPPRRSK